MKMKNIGFIVCLLALLSACEEEGPFINFEEEQATLVDTSYVSTTPIPSVNKNVLFEEFSGVRCSNCPLGNAVTNGLFNSLGDRFVPVTVHSDFLALPYGNDQDLRNSDANSLASSLGPVGVKPSTFVNRKIINGSRLQQSPGTWSGLVNNELAQSSFVKMNLEIVDADETERIVRYRITLSYNQNAPNHNLGFYLTESEIIAEQLDGSVKISNYEHEFVLRQSISPLIGANIGSDVTQNTVIIKEFKIDIDDYDTNNIWTINHMYVVAFVRLDNDDIETATMAKLIP
tara:strand:+ start:13368 stop:14231 length:864 start_codon:yes stop_codon:yes gene_type:complete